MAQPAQNANPRRGERGPREGGGGPRGDRRPRKPVTESDFQEKVVQISRVTKVVKGGKKMSFRAVVVVGNGKGKVGVGIGKANEVVYAIQKGVADAKKNLVDVPLVNTTIPHLVIGEDGAGKVLLRPASQGTGVIAGGAVRAVVELSGIKDILSKSLGSSNLLSNARATLAAFKLLKTVEKVATAREKSAAEIVG